MSRHRMGATPDLAPKIPPAKPPAADDLEVGLDEIARTLVDLHRENEQAKTDLHRVRAILPELVEFLGVVRRGSIGPVAKRATKWQEWISALLPDESEGTQ